MAKKLIKSNHNIYGLDNLNDYYDVSLKKDRLNQISNNENFKFEKIDISDRQLLEDFFSNNKIDMVVNLAAQPGVRYSIENPYAYMNSNLVGFLNIIECCRHNNVEGFIYASSSSVYGGNTKVPFSTLDSIDNPISLYAATKASNELIAKTYSHLYGIHTTGLRFFTVYGPWGRPDMAYYKFTEKIYNKKIIDVYNNGNMKRDFTYIDDIVDGIESAIDNNYKCEIFNLGNNQSESLKDFIQIIEKEINLKAKINYMPMQSGDMKETFADIKKSQSMLKFNPKTNLSKGISKFVSWYKKYYNI